MPSTIFFLNFEGFTGTIDICNYWKRGLIFDNIHALGLKYTVLYI